MKKSLTNGVLSRRRIIAIVLSLSFLFGTAALTLVQAASIEKSLTRTIYNDGYMVVDLQIHNYNFNPNPDFTIFHAILKITNNYMEDIYVKTIYIESWSGPKNGPSSVQYANATRTDILVPAQETVVIRLNLKAYHFSVLIKDDSVYSYYTINWLHGGNEYTKFGLYMENAAKWWQLLYPDNGNG